MNFIVWPCFVFFFLILMASAQEALDQETFRIYDSKANFITITQTAYYNSNGILETRIDAAGISKLKDFNPTIGYGRDLDDNGKIDTWFFITQNGIETIQKEGITTLGMDVLGDLVVGKYQSSVELYLSTITTTILSYLSFTASHLKDNKTNFYIEWMNLEELSIHLQSEEKKPTHLTKTQFEHLQVLQKIGYDQLKKQMENVDTEGVPKYVALDIGLWFMGGAILKLGSKLLSVPIKSLTETSVFQSLSGVWEKFLSHQKHLLETKLKTIKEKIHTIKQGQNTVADTTIHFSARNWKKKLGEVLHAYFLKRKLMAGAKNVFIDHKGEWFYVGASTMLQTVAEGGARYDEIKDPNLLIATGNLLGNSEVRQNISFMTLDTLLMTAVSSQMKTLKAKFMVSGVVAITNSAFINFMVKKEDNYQRVAFDTSWESIVGNSQVQADLAALTFFENLAKKKQNSKLKLLGWAFVVVDQGTGYFLYSKSSSYVEKADLKEFLIPIMASSDAHDVLLLDTLD